MRLATALAPFVLAEGIAGHVIKRNVKPNMEFGNRRLKDSEKLKAQECQATGKAVYLLTNDAENAVVALPINADGTLSKGTSTKSGGKGATSINGATGELAATDALISQGALTVAGQFIFAVNAGSNTLSMLSISETDPTKLTLVGEPVEVPGEFPNTVAASAKNSLACVAMTGAVAGISCASFDGEKGLGAMDDLRPIDLGQSTPPVGPTNTVSHTFFSEDESTLFTMVKGDPAANKTGFVSSLAVEQKTMCGGQTMMVAAAEDTRSSPEGTAVLFGSQVIPGTGNIFTTDASFGGAVLSVDAATGEAAVAAMGAIEDQVATCWAAFSPMTKSVFVTDVAVPRIVEMSAEDASILSMLDLSETGDPGFVDLRAAGAFVYVLAPGNGTADAAVSVLDISGGQGQARAIQRFSLDGVAGNTAQGIATLD
ncbi:hypothetical protein DL764_002001 [Monosporascus ibericus]|uniref:3-carboxymuconate cyclase n=1 Tax=Monosporascus ibericus TaxID=155417 RepID=A0A4Q4TQL7_9PEZI|nr:hypothetical protein DL764_002001 [Monosporascus ibericus]